MVRVNLVNPKVLADQHLIAEYREILLLFGIYRKRNGNKISKSDNNLMHPVQFYQDKLLYLKHRHEDIKEEMKKRNFKPKKTIDINDFNFERLNDWNPKKEHIDKIKERITQRLNEKPSWYRYYGEYKTPKFFEELMK